MAKKKPKTLADVLEKTTEDTVKDSEINVVSEYPHNFKADAVILHKRIDILNQRIDRLVAAIDKCKRVKGI